MTELKHQIKRVIEYSQDIPYNEIDINTLLDTWAHNKQHFFKAFGGYIYEYPIPVKFNLSSTEKYNRLMDFCDSIEFASSELSELAAFVYEFKDDFYNNITTYDYITSDGTVIPANSKIIRAFKFFIKDKDMLNVLQNEASMLLQDDKISGTLCLSVHPLDFLSSSENTYNWRSCHALDGDFKAGNLSYIMDDSTFICYIKGSHEDKLPGFPEDVPWNSKKWRMLVNTNFNQSLFFAGRQYPCESENILNIIRDILIQLFNIPQDNLSNWCNINENKDSIVINNDKSYKLSFMVRNTDSLYPLHYNDILCSTVYIPQYLYQRDISSYPPIMVGNSVSCVRCGKKNICNSKYFLCNNCANELYKMYNYSSEYQDTSIPINFMPL